MRHKRGLLQLLALLFAFALVAAACGDSDDDDSSTDTTAAPTEDDGDEGETSETTAAPETTEAADDGAADDDGAAATGGELVLGAEQWPECLNPIQSCANASWRTWAVGTHVEARAMELDIDNNFVPSPVLVEEPTVDNGGLVTNDDGTFTLTYNINPDAVWSDGTPITSADFEFTWRAYNDTTGVLSTSGYDLITGVDTSDPQTAVITFESSYAPWPDLFGGTTNVLLPAHGFEGTDIADDWLQEIPISGGPWLLESFSQEQAIFSPNDAYWVEDRKPLVDRVVIVPLEDTDTEVAALQAGEVQAIFPQPFPGAIERLTGDLTYIGGGGTFMEGLWINQNAPEENAGAQAVDSVAVRQALAYSLDREQIADIALGTSIENPEVLNCAGWNPTFGDWCDQTDFEIYQQDEAKVDELLTGDGWTRDGDGLWQKDGQELVLQWNTVAGNARREDVQALVVEMTRPFGIGWEIVNYDAGELFENRLPVMNFGPVALFANSTSPDPTVAALYGQIPTEENDFSGQNYTAWTNARVMDELIPQSDAEVDPEARLELIREIGDLAAEEVPWIPLYLLPNAFAYRTAELGGGVGEYTFHAWGGFHNIYDWELTG